MVEEKEEKIVIFATHGAEDPDRATIPFVIANVALAMKTKVVVVLQSTGVTLATTGMYEHIFASGFDPLSKLVGSFIELGGTVLVCIPCIEQRKITPDRLIKGAQTVKPTRVVEEMLSANAVLSY